MTRPSLVAPPNPIKLNTVPRKPTRLTWPTQVASPREDSDTTITLMVAAILFCVSAYVTTVMFSGALPRSTSRGSGAVLPTSAAVGSKRVSYWRDAAAFSELIVEAMK